MAPSILRSSSQEDRIARRAIKAVPDLLSPEEIERERFIDNNSFRNPGDLMTIFDYHSTYEPFTTEEELIFAQAFKRNPKEFAAIAEVLPNRTAAECLKHYYANKSDSRFKTESLRQREAENGPKADTYDYGDSESRGNMQCTEKATKDRNFIPIDQEIKRLRAETGEEGKLFSKRSAPARQRPVVLPPPDLAVVRQGFRPPLNTSDQKLFIWLRSADVLPLLKRWQQLCLDDPEMKAQMEKMLHKDDRPWTARVDQIADHSIHYGDKDFEAELKMKWAKAFVLCAHYACKMVKCSRLFFEGFKPYGFSEIDRMIVGVATLFTVYDDLIQNQEGFFGILLESPLAQPMAASVRKSWEAKYLFEGEEDYNDANTEELMARSKAIPPPRFPTSRPQQRSHLMKRPGPPTCNTHTKAPSGKQIDLTNTSDQDSSDSSDEFDEPGDDAGRSYKAKAEGLYHAMKKMEAKLKEVEAERDAYQARFSGQEDSSGVATNSTAAPARTTVRGPVADIKALRAKLNESEHAREELELEVEQMKACGSQQERHIESLEEAVSNNLGEKQALSGSIQLSAEDPKELASHAALGTIRALEEEISQLKEENAALKLDKDEVDQGL
jgi:hypothetical protein